MSNKEKRAAKRAMQEKLQPLEWKTENQKDYMRSIAENAVTLCSGPAGCGKSFIAAGMAAQALKRGDVDRIIIARPIVGTGKDIGALPGDINEKIDPYLKPMQENLRWFFGKAKYGEHCRSKAIEYYALQTMRGASFDESFMILDEAQNCTLEEIRMFATRMGQDSVVVINGDVDQVDITNSGLEQAISQTKASDRVSHIGVCEMDYDDIQRSPIITEILKIFK